MLTRKVNNIAGGILSGYEKISCPLLLIRQIQIISEKLWEKRLYGPTLKKAIHEDEGCCW